MEHTTLSIITFEGILELFRRKQSGEPLPEGWQALVQRYVDNKSRQIWRKESELEASKKQLSEAVEISKALGLIWEKK